MPDRLQPTVFEFQHPWASDLPQQTRQLNYLLAAENIIHETGGQTRKIGGATKINSTAITGGPDITGMFDYWRAGTGGTFTQKFMAVTGDGKVYKEDMDGVFDDITGAAVIAANSIPVFCQARDLLLIFFDTNAVPLTWNQTGNVATLGGSVPLGRGALFAHNRPWTWGDNANPSRLTYGSSTVVADFTGIDTGSIDIDPDDGDRLIGAVFHQKIIFVFKGPNKGSIHAITGTAPTGAEGFAKHLVVRGIPLQSHNSIVPFGKDVMFMSERGIHSLSALLQAGNMEEENNVTRYHKSFFKNQINRTVLNKTWGVDYSSNHSLVWTLQSNGGTEPDLAFGLSVIKLKEKGYLPFKINRQCLSAAIRIHPTTKVRELIFGGTDGFARRQDTSDRNIDGTTSYGMRVTTPQILLSSADAQGHPKGDQPVKIQRLYLRSISVGDYNVVVNLTRDEQSAESYNFNQGSKGFLLDTSVLDVDILGGTSALINYADPFPIGEARAVQFDITQNGVNEDANLIEMGIDWIPTGQSSQSEL